MRKKRRPNHKEVKRRLHIRNKRIEENRKKTTAISKAQLKRAKKIEKQTIQEKVNTVKNLVEEIIGDESKKDSEDSKN